MSVNFTSFDEGDVDGYLDYQSSTRSATLGITLKDHSFSFYAEDRPFKGYLVIITESPPDFVKWRLWLNNFSLTKEFKPNLTYPLEDRRELHFHIFDITHLIAKGKNELTVNYNGARPLTVRLTNVTMVMKSVGFLTKYSLKGGLLQVKPGEVIYLTSMGKNYIIMKNNSRGRIKLFNGKNSEDILELGPDCEEIDAEGESLKIANHSTDHRAVTQLLLHYTYKSQTPILDFDVVPLISGDTLSLKVVNTGDVDIEKVTMNVMINGVTIGFKTVERVSKGGEAQCTLPLPKKKGSLFIRSVGIRAGLRKIVDKELNREAT